VDFSTEFILIGEDQDPDIAQDVTPSAPATVFSIDQDLYLESGGQWKKGDPVGEAHGSGVVTGKNLATCSVTFAFDAEDSIVAEGLLPVQGKKLDAGRLAVTGGTGQFDKVSGRVGMETRNPKRWSFVI
jgi:hypothetical protein